LDILLKEDSKGPYKMIAIELLARGFPTWEPFINSSAVIRTIISSTGLASLGASANQMNTSTPSKTENAPNASPQPASHSTQNTPPPNPALILVARQAIVILATANPTLFISTITFDITHSKSPAERIGGLKLLGMFLNKVCI
jgi:hypothetical protein